MKRRSFIAALTLSMLGFGVFSFITRVRGVGINNVLAQPKLLSLICDKSTIRKLGGAYLNLKPKENDQKLLKGLLIDKSSKIFLEKQFVTSVESQIEKRIKNDFYAYDIVVVDGWVLSITEARQCALYSIING